MTAGRHKYFILSFSLSLLAVIFCAMVYQAGQFPDFQVSVEYLSGIPNYYFFFALILPFIAVGVMYIALENKSIRFWGELSDELDDVTRSRVERFRKILPLIALLFSILVIIQDAADKTTALPPYSIDLGQAEIERVTRYFACQKHWPEVRCETLAAPDMLAQEYLDILEKNGFTGLKISGFDSFGHWLEQSSTLYKMESLLSFLAALIISLLFVQIFLLIIAKNQVKAATKSLVIWMAVLSSIWFPTKMISSRHSDLGINDTPIILFFGVVLLLVGILLIVFLKMERNDVYKFASIATAIFSAILAALSKMNPELMDYVIGVISRAGWIYTAITCFILMFSLYLVTDHFISDYEREASNDS